MSLAFAVFEERSRLSALLAHFCLIPDPRDPWRVAHPLREVLLPVVCGTMAERDDDDNISAWAKKPSTFLHADDRPGRRISPGKCRPSLPFSHSTSSMTLTLGRSMRPWPLSWSTSTSITPASAKALSISARKLGWLALTASRWSEPASPIFCAILALVAMASIETSAPFRPSL
jgi:hypothetical protein